MNLQTQIDLAHTEGWHVILDSDVPAPKLEMRNGYAPKQNSHFVGVFWLAHDDLIYDFKCEVFQSGTTLYVRGWNSEDFWITEGTPESILLSQAGVMIHGLHGIVHLIEERGLVWKIAGVMGNYYSTVSSPTITMSASFSAPFIEESLAGALLKWHKLSRYFKDD